MDRLHFGLRLKALLPIAGVLLLGILLFIWETISLGGSMRNRIILIAAAGAVAILAAMLAIMAVLIQRPLIELQQKLNRLRDGDLTVTVRFADQSDEIGDLGRNFNETVRQLRESREEIQRLYRVQMSKAEHLATLGELAAGLAHEIRNPLAGIAGVIEIIGRNLPESSPKRQVLQEVQREVQQIKRIVSDLLDYARPKPSRFIASDLNATVEQAVALARQQVLSRPIEIDLTQKAGLPLVEHDATKIQQVLVNLLLNAIQATNEEGRVQVTLESRESFALIRVKDSGRGISQEDLPNIFRPFFTTKGQGTGLGLSLAHRIVEDHGGRIEVTSVLGRGSEFAVWLPFHKPALHAVPS